MIKTNNWIKKLTVAGSVLKVSSIFIVAVLLFHFEIKQAYAQTSYTPTKSYQGSGTADQDDMVVWVHPTNSAQSTVIASDKAANRVTVYNLDGSVVQTVTDVGIPGNIDLRYKFPLSGQLVDIVAFNDRAGSIIRVFKINADRTLTRVDNGLIKTSFANYGFTLYKSRTSGKMYGVTSQDNGSNIEQFELLDAGGGKVGGTRVRGWSTGGGQSEGMVSDDEKGFLYVGQERSGVWKLGAEPTTSAPGTIIIPASSNGISPDIEGLTIYYTGNGNGYLMLSSQGNSTFKVFDRNAPYTFRSTFKVGSASSTDGIDVSSVNLGSIYPQGVFLAHSGGAAIRAVPWNTIAQGEGLTVDTSWNPRGGVTITQPPQTNTPTQPATNTNTSTPRPSATNSITATPALTSIPGSNIALQKSVTASSSDADAPNPAAVVDGDANTRWSSAWSQPHWVQIDLGERYEVDRVILRWQRSYGSGYRIEVSEDSTNWTSIYTTSTGDGGVDELTGIQRVGRYIRMYGTQRACDGCGTLYGFSLFEFEVYGDHAGLINTPALTQGGLGGDANGDGHVDGVDFVTWLQKYNQTTSNGPRDGDFNSDGKIDGIDYIVWLTNYGKASNGTPSVTNPPPVTNTNTPSPRPSITGLTVTPTPRPTSTPTIGGPTPTLPPIGQVKGIWISPEEIIKLPTSGAAWDRVRSAAYGSWGSSCLNDLNCLHDTDVLAGALVSVRLNDSALRQKTITGIRAAMSSPLYRTLELARNIQSYVIAADIIGYHDAEFDNFLRAKMDQSLPGRAGIPTVWQGSLKDATNWGNHQRAAAIATYLYLGDSSRMNQVTNAYKEWIGLPVTTRTMTYDATNWIADQSNKAGVNRYGSTISGVNVSGVLPEDWRRGSEFNWLPTPSGYMWEGMQGYIVASVMLHRAGLIPFSSGNNVVVRSMNMLYGLGEASTNSPVFRNPASSDDTWIPWVVNYYGNTNYPTSSASAGKNMGWTDWTHP